MKNDLQGMNMNHKWRRVRGFKKNIATEYTATKTQSFNFYDSETAHKQNNLDYCQKKAKEKNSTKGGQHRGRL